MPRLGPWIGRGAAEDQTRQCPNRLGNRCRGILRDDLAYATRVRARSTLRSDDESPRPIRGFHRGSFEAVFGCSDPRVRRAIEICTLVRLIERLRLFASAKLRQP